MQVGQLEECWVAREISACVQNCLLRIPLQECKRVENYAHSWTEMEIILRETLQKSTNI